MKRTSCYQHSLLQAMREWLPGQFFSSWPVARSRCWTAQRTFWLGLLMVWSSEQTLGERFDAVRGWLKARLPHWRLGGSYQGWFDAQQKWLTPLLPVVSQRLRQQMQAMASGHWQQQGWCAFAVDGSRIECPRSRANEKELGCAGRKKTGPQLFLTTLWHMGLGLPWDYRIGPGKASERRHLEDMLPDLPLRSLLVADAGFTGYDLSRRMLAAGHSFVLRVGSNVSLLTKLGWAQREGASTVYLWPEKRWQQSPIRLRLIVVGRGKNRVYLVTNVLDQKELSNQSAGIYYQMRWGVEVFYRSCKQTLQRRRMLSRCPVGCRCELHWTVLGVWLLGLMSVRAILQRGGAPLSWSVALARRVVRQALHGSRRGDLLRALSEATKDNYERTRSKKARNWPHKKNDPPPGKPKIKAATREQRRALNRFKAKSKAA